MEKIITEQVKSKFNELDDKEGILVTHYWFFVLITGGRYSSHGVDYSDGYSSPYDSSPFQTVPNSVPPTEHWSSNAPSNNHPELQHSLHPAFLHNRGESITSYAINGETKSILPPAMMPGYSGKYWQSQVVSSKCTRTVHRIFTRFLLFQVEDPASQALAPYSCGNFY